jgi:hypothetical protein
LFGSVVDFAGIGAAVVDGSHSSGTKQGGVIDTYEMTCWAAAEACWQCSLVARRMVLGIFHVPVDLAFIVRFGRLLTDISDDIDGVLLYALLLPPPPPPVLLLLWPWPQEVVVAVVGVVVVCFAAVWYRQANDCCKATVARTLRCIARTEFERLIRWAAMRNMACVATEL